VLSVKQVDAIWHGVISVFIGSHRTVRIFRQKFTLEDTIEIQAYAPLEALPCV
jgi:hypothetical protein